MYSFSWYLTYVHKIAAFVSCLSKGLQLCLFSELSIIYLKVDESENRFQNKDPLETHFLVFESLNVDSAGFWCLMKCEPHFIIIIKRGNSRASEARFLSIGSRNLESENPGSEFEEVFLSLTITRYMLHHIDKFYCCILFSKQSNWLNNHHHQRVPVLQLFY